VQVESLALFGAFITPILAALILLFKMKGRIKDNLFKFVFYVGLITQAFIRCAFLVLPVFWDQRKFGEFYDNFPASIWTSLCTVVLLQWIKAATVANFAPPLIFFILVNTVMYVILFLLPAFEAFLAIDAVLILFTSLFCVVWTIHVFAIVTYLVKTYPWNTATREWTDHKKQIVTGFILLTICLCVRIGLLLYSTIVYDNAFNLDYPNSEYASRELPDGLLFVYYGLAELFPSFLMIMIQHYLPANLLVRPYGELERLIAKMKSETIDYSVDKILCKVCLEREINTAFLPCRHSATCDECSKSIKECPLCRQQIGQTLLLFKA